MSKSRKPSSSPRTKRRGVDVLHDPLLNKGTAFTERERDALGLRGLLPPHVSTIDEQLGRVLANFRGKHTDLERYVNLMALQDRNETLFYRLVLEHLEEMMPIIYTPTVGQACQEYGHIYQRPRGIYLSARDRGRVGELLSHWPREGVRIIVVTDGERILGLGDLGAFGMGIPVGKLALYTLCAGIDPAQCLPVMIDVGTENENLLADPLYTGLGQHRVRGAAYDALVDEFMREAQKLFPRVLIQFEDFANANAFRLLEHYKDRALVFNDDIQGTAAVALAGLLSALRLTKGKLAQQRILFLGAGEAGVGIAELIVRALTEEGLSPAEARSRCFFVDSQGLVVRSREGLAAHKIPFAHDVPFQPTLLEAVRALTPTALIGVSTVAKAFDRDVLGAMAEKNERPIVFALSNPTSKSECSAEEAYRFTEGRAVFASGSPFAPVELGGKRFEPGQGNNAYIFPGVGLGVIASQAKRVSQGMFLAAAKALAAAARPDDLAVGRVYPSLSRIRRVSASIGAEVARVALAEGLARIPRPRNLQRFVEAQMWKPEGYVERR